MPASIAGCKLEAGVPPGGRLEDDELAADDLDLELDFLADLLLDDDDLATSGAAMILAALGVVVVLHCHSPSA